MTDAIEFFVLGRPYPKGSLKHYVPRGANGAPVRRPNGSVVVNVTNDRVNTRPWQDAVTWAAKLAMRGRPPFEKEPLVLEAVFARQRPTSQYTPAGGLKTNAPIAPIAPPDVDKYARLAGDAMTRVCFRDDARIVSYRAHKIFARTEGAAIVLRVATAMDLFQLDALYARLSGVKLEAAQARLVGL